MVQLVHAAAFFDVLNVAPALHGMHSRSAVVLQLLVIVPSGHSVQVLHLSVPILSA